MFFNYVSNPSKALAGGDGVVTPNAAGEPGGVQVRGRYRMNCGQKKHPLRGGGAFFVFLFKFTNLKKKTKKSAPPQYYFFRAGGRRGGLPPRRWWRPFVFGWACFLCFVRFLLRFAARRNVNRKPPPDAHATRGSLERLAESTVASFFLEKNPKK